MSRRLAFNFLAVAFLLYLVVQVPPGEAAVETNPLWGYSQVRAETPLEDGFITAWLGTSSSDSTQLAPRTFAAGETVYVWLRWSPDGVNTQDHLHIVQIGLRNDETDTVIRDLCVNCGEAGASLAQDVDLFYASHTLNEVGTFRLFVDGAAHNALHVLQWRANSDGSGPHNDDGNTYTGYFHADPKFTNLRAYKSDYVALDDKLVRGETLYVRFNADKNIGSPARLILDAGASTGFRQEVDVVARGSGGTVLWRASFALVDSTSSSHWASSSSFGTLSLSKPSFQEYRIAWTPSLTAPTGVASIVVEVARQSGLVPADTWTVPRAGGGQATREAAPADPRDATPGLHHLSTFGEPGTGMATNGKYGAGYDLDGANDHLVRFDDLGLKLDGSFSLFVVFRLDTLAQAANLFDSVKACNFRFGHLQVTTSGALHYIHSPGGAANTFDSATGLVGVGTEYRLWVKRDVAANTLRVQVNGVMAIDGTFQDDPTNTIIPDFYVGVLRDCGGFSSRLDGVVSELRLWRGALVADTVLDRLANASDRNDEHVLVGTETAAYYLANDAPAASFELGATLTVTATSSLAYANRGETTTIAGIVTDPWGAPLASATVNVDAVCSGTHLDVALPTTSPTGTFSAIWTVPSTAPDTYTNARPGVAETKDCTVEVHYPSTNGDPAQGSLGSQGGVLDVDDDYYFQSETISDGTLNRGDTVRASASFRNVRNTSVPDGTTVQLRWRDAQDVLAYTTSKTTAGGSTANWDQILGNTEAAGVWDFGYQILATDPGNNGNSLPLTHRASLTVSASITVQSLDVDVVGQSTTRYFNRGESVTVTGVLRTGANDAFYQTQTPSGNAARTVLVHLYRDTPGGVGTVTSGPATVSTTTGAFTATLTFPGTAPDSYASTAPGVLEATEWNVEILDAGATPGGPSHNHGSSPDQFDVDSGLFADVHTQRTLPLVKDEPGEEREDEDYYIAADQVNAWVHARNVRGEDWPNLAVSLALYPPGSQAPKATANVSTDATGWTEAAAFDTVPPAGTWTLTAASPATGNDEPSSDTVRFLSPNTDAFILDPVGWNDRLELGKPATFQLRTLRYERGNSTLYEYAPDGAPRIIAHWAIAGGGAWTLAFDAPMVHVEGTTWRFDWNVPSDPAWVDRRVSVKFGASFSGAWKWSPTESAIIQRGGADPMEVVASPAIANPGETVLIIIHEAFLDGAARTGNAAGTQVYLYRPDGSLAVNGASPAEVAHGTYRYAYALGASPMAGNWYVVAKTTDAATGATNSAATTFFVEADLYALVQSFQADTQARLVALQTDVDALQLDAASLLAKWGTQNAAGLAADLSTVKTRVGDPADASTASTVFGKIQALRDQDAANTATLDARLVNLQASAATIQSVLDQTRTELGAAGKTRTAYRLLEDLEVLANRLQVDLTVATQYVQGELDTTRALVGYWPLNEVEGNGPNLVTNGGFEEYPTSPGAPTGWTVSGGTATRETSLVRTGAFSVKFTPTGASTAEGLAQPLAGLVPGRTYVATAHGRTEATGGQSVRLVVRNVSDGTTVGTATGLANEDAYRYLNLTWVPQQGKTYHLQAFKWGGATSTTPIYFEDVAVREVQAADLSASRTSATLQGGTGTSGPSLGVPGRQGYAYEFDGVDDSLTIPNNKSRNTGSFSLEFWAKPDVCRTQGILRKTLTVGWSGRVFMTGPSCTIEVDSKDATTELGNLQSQPLTAGVGAHVIVTYDKPAQTLRLYRNGALDAQNLNVADMRWEQPGPILVADQATNRWDGPLDEPRVYNRALTAREAAARHDPDRHLANLETILLRVDGNLSALRSDLQTRLMTIQADVDLLQVDAAALVAKWGTITATQLASDLTSLSGRVGASTDAGTVPSLFGRLRDLSDRTYEHTGLEEQVTDLQGAVVDLRAVLNATRAELGAQGQSPSVYARLVSLGSQVSTVEAELAEARRVLQRGQDPTRALAARWSFDSSTMVLDDLDGPMGLLRGDARLGVLGRVGRAVELDGAGDYIEVPLSPLGLAPSSLTLEAWVKPDAVPTGGVRRILQVSEGASGTSHVSLNYDTAGKVGFEARPTAFGSSVGISSNAAITLSVWTHVAGAVESSGTMRFYVNGVVQTPFATLPSLSNLDTVSIGADLSAGGVGGTTPEGFLDGLVDEPGFYDRGLTGREVSLRVDSHHEFLTLEAFVTNLQVDTQTWFSALQADVDVLQVDASNLLAKWGTVSAPALQADLATVITRVGQASDPTTASTLFGKVQALRDLTGTRTANVHATLNTTKSTLDALRSEVGAAGKTRTAYRLAEDLESLLQRVDANLTAAEARVRSDVAALRSELVSRLGALQADAGALRNDTADLRAHWGTLDAADLDARLQTLDNRLGSSTDPTTAATLFGRVENLRALTGARLTNLHGDLNATRITLDATRSELGAFGKTRTAYRLLEDLEGRAKLVEGNVTAAQAAIQADLAALRADLTTRLNGLEADVSGVRADTTALLGKWGTLTAASLDGRLSSIQSRIGVSTDSATAATLFGRLQALGETSATQTAVSTLHASLNATRAVLDAARAETGAEGKTRTTYRLVEDVEAKLYEVSGELALARAVLQAEHSQAHAHFLSYWSLYNATEADHFALLLGRVQSLEDRLASDFAAHRNEAQTAWATIQANLSRLDRNVLTFEERLNATLSDQRAALLAVLEALTSDVERQRALTLALWHDVNETAAASDQSHEELYHGLLANLTVLGDDLVATVDAHAGQARLDVAGLRSFTAGRLDEQEASLRATILDLAEGIRENHTSLAALLVQDGNGTRALLRNYSNDANETWAAWSILFANRTTNETRLLRAFVAAEHNATRTNATFLQEAYFAKYGAVVREYSGYVVGGLGEAILTNREKIEEGRRASLLVFLWQNLLAEVLKYGLFGILGLALVVMIGNRRVRRAIRAFAPLARVLEPRRRPAREIEPRHQANSEPAHKGKRVVAFLARR